MDTDWEKQHGKAGIPHDPRRQGWFSGINIPIPRKKSSKPPQPKYDFTEVQNQLNPIPKQTSASQERAIPKKNQDQWEAPIPKLQQLHTFWSGDIQSIQTKKFLKSRIPMGDRSQPGMSCGSQRLSQLQTDPSSQHNPNFSQSRICRMRRRG